MSLQVVELVRGDRRPSSWSWSVELVVVVVVAESSPGTPPSAKAASAPTASSRSSTSSHGQRERLRGVGRGGSFSPLRSGVASGRGAMRVASAAGTNSVGSCGTIAVCAAVAATGTRPRRTRSRSAANSSALP